MAKGITIPSELQAEVDAIMDCHPNPHFITLLYAPTTQVGVSCLEGIDGLEAAAVVSDKEAKEVIDELDRVLGSRHKGFGARKKVQVAVSAEGDAAVAACEVDDTISEQPRLSDKFVVCLACECCFTPAASLSTPWLLPTGIAQVEDVEGTKDGPQWEGGVPLGDFLSSPCMGTAQWEGGRSIPRIGTLLRLVRASLRAASRLDSAALLGVMLGLGPGLRAGTGHCERGLGSLSEGAVNRLRALGHRLCTVGAHRPPRERSHKHNNNDDDDDAGDAEEGDENCDDDLAGERDDGNGSQCPQEGHEDRCDDEEAMCEILFLAGQRNSKGDAERGAKGDAEGRTGLVRVSVGSCTHFLCRACLANYAQPNPERCASQTRFEQQRCCC